MHIREFRWRQELNWIFVFCTHLQARWTIMNDQRCVGRSQSAQGPREKSTVPNSGTHVGWNMSYVREIPVRMTTGSNRWPLRHEALQFPNIVVIAADSIATFIFLTDRTSKMTFLNSNIGSAATQSKSWLPIPNFIIPSVLSLLLPVTVSGPHCSSDT